MTAEQMSDALKKRRFAHINPGAVRDVDAHSIIVLEDPVTVVKEVRVWSDRGIGIRPFNFDWMFWIHEYTAMAYNIYMIDGNHLKLGISLSQAEVDLFKSFSSFIRSANSQQNRLAGEVERLAKEIWQQRVDYWKEN